MLTIKQLRKKIDDIDASIIKKISARQKLSIQIGRLKSEMGDRIVDVKREETLMHRYEALAKKNQLHDALVKRIFKLIILQSRKLQK